jgi:hypothetical protein
MKNAPLLVFGFFALVLASMAPARAADSIDNLPLFGGILDYSERRGYLDFGGGHIEQIDRKGMFDGGVVLGKRWRLTHRLRLQVSATIHYGSVTDDTLPLISLDNGTSATTLVETTVFHGGCIAELQYPLTFSPDGQWFLLGGGGIHVARYREFEELTDGSKTKVIGDPYVEGGHVTVSASVHGGIGFEIIVSPLFGLAFTYTLRYWNPISYGMTRDLFPMESIAYHERYFTHEFCIMVLAKR